MATLAPERISGTFPGDVAACLHKRARQCNMSVSDTLVTFVTETIKDKAGESGDPFDNEADVRAIDEARLQAECEEYGVSREFALEVNRDPFAALEKLYESGGGFDREAMEEYLREAREDRKNGWRLKEVDREFALDEDEDPIVALRKFHESGGLDPKVAEDFLREIREDRKNGWR